MRPFQWYPFVDFHSVHRTNRTHNNIHAGIHPFNVYYDSCLVRGSPDFFHLSYKSMCFAMYYTVHKRHAAPVFHLLGSSDWTLPDQLLWGEVLQGVLCRLQVIYCLPERGTCLACGYEGPITFCHQGQEVYCTNNKGCEWTKAMMELSDPPADESLETCPYS